MVTHLIAYGVGTDIPTNYGIPVPVLTVLYLWGN